jgi:DNA-binding beta-propeller fold protein YncE
VDQRSPRRRCLADRRADEHGQADDRRRERGAIDTGSGSVWVANRVTGTVSRIDPTSGRIVERIKVAKRVGDLVVGEGAVWVTVP